MRGFDPRVHQKVNFMQSGWIAGSSPAMTNVPARLVSLRRHPQDASGGAVGEQPQRAVEPDAHVADALAQVLQQALFLAHLLAVELEAYQCLSGERADEQVAAPRREQVAGIERHAGR